MKITQNQINMKEKQKKNFVKVTYNLLATTKLSSTQKLFISYIIGWQKNGKVCFETNNNLALKFGMKYSGIRSVITELNKRDFFKSKSKDYDKKTGTSGHEITVDVDKLEKFLGLEKQTNKSISTEVQFNSQENSNLSEGENINENEVKKLPTYHLNDTVELNEILAIFNFNDKDANEIRQHFQSSKITFDSFVDYYVSLVIDSQMQEYKGIIITKEQDDRFIEICAKQ